MIKKFMYFQSEDGGMTTFGFSIPHPKNHMFPTLDKFFSAYLYGWLGRGTKKGDKALLEWTASAKLGDVFYHRLGVCVRVSGRADGGK